MTKEEILIKHESWECKSSEQVAKLDYAYLAMEEYGKNQAIKFIEWVFQSDILKSNYHIDANIYFYDKSGEAAAYSTEELYSLFLKETAK